MKNLKKLIPVAIAIVIIAVIIVARPGSCMCVTSPSVYKIAKNVISVTDDYLSMDISRLEAADRIARYLDRAEAADIDIARKDAKNALKTTRDLKTLCDHFVNGAGDAVLIADRNQLAYDIGIPEKTDY